MRRVLCFLGCLTLLLAGAATVDATGPVRTGDYVHQGLETPHPYPTSGEAEAMLTWADQVTFPGASYIKLHFSRFELAPGDSVVIRSLAREQEYTYTGTGPRGLGVQPGGFYGTILWGDTAEIELYTTGENSAYGFAIDHFIRGFAEGDLEYFWSRGISEPRNIMLPSTAESACTTVDYENAICYETTHPEIYDKARAVIRLHIGGSACTGWLIGNAGHVMTNEHCIGSQSSLNGTDFELMGEGTTCAQNCDSWGACPGPIEASGGTLVQLDSALDYTLVMPDTSGHGGTDLPGTYGYLQLRPDGAVVGERLYHPQHPNVYGKKIAVFSTYPGDPDGWPHVVSKNETPCSGGPGDVGYWADTAGGSSGSPSLALSDHRVVALHHCRGSAACASGNPSSDDPNRGVPIEAVIADLGANLPPGATCSEYPGPTNVVATAAGDNHVQVTWDAVSGTGITYRLLRAIGTCPQTDWEFVADGLTGTAYDDYSVSGGTTYAYHLVAIDEDNCESLPSDCTDVAATGACIRAPDFLGVNTALNQQTDDCAVLVSWNPASGNCGTDVSYNVYRSTTPDFDPAPVNLIASCVDDVTYLDVNVMSGVEYYYTVRSEDDSGNGAGPCAGGNEDQNSFELAAMPTGPDTVFFADDMETGDSNWVIEPGPMDTGASSPWYMVETDYHSATHSFYVQNQSGMVKDQVLRMAAPADLTGAASGVLEFWHRFQTEDGYDGGVLEFSVDGGTSWHDILDGDGGSIPANPTRFVQGGYVGTLGSGAGQPMPGRDAWTGNNGDWEEVIVDLTDFAGETVHFRWRFGNDTIIAGVGWWVDDVRVIQGSSCTTAGSLIFTDGFESGDTDMWSGVTP